MEKGCISTAEDPGHRRALRVPGLLGRCFCGPGCLLAWFFAGSGRPFSPSSRGMAPLVSACLSRVAAVLRRCFAIQDVTPSLPQEPLFLGRPPPPTPHGS